MYNATIFDVWDEVNMVDGQEECSKDVAKEKLILVKLYLLWIS